ncbi:penicillin-binding protein 1B, partial [Buchnera aphidicola (Hormaphis cornu)]
MSYFFLIFTIYILYWYGQLRFYLSRSYSQMPALIYGRIVNLDPNVFHTKKEIISILNNNGYRNVRYLTSPGEFYIYRNSIDFIRRSFCFPDSNEFNVKIRLTFYQNILIEIKNLETNCNLSCFRLDPKLITTIQNSSTKKQLYLSFKKYPQVFIEILLAVEDRYFYHHNGINFHSIVRALFENIVAGHTVQGGSTLTQQLVKNLFLENKRSLLRKINEGLIALIMNLVCGKRYILELYLNKVYLGQEKNEQIYGFPLASMHYFGKPLSELSLDQYALLIGMLKGASLYNPWTNPKKALDRRNLVLYLLLNRHIIDNRLYQVLIKRSLHVQDKKRAITSHIVFSKVIRKKILQNLKKQVKDLSGLRIFTTLDPVSQEFLDQAVEQGIPVLKKRMKLEDLEIAVVIVDRFTGEIRAILGGSNPNYLGFNRAFYAKRSIGSLAKPIIYLTALSEPDKYQLNTNILDKPISLELSNGNFWIPKNSNNMFVGPVMLIDALVHSINIPIVNLSIQLGLKKLVNKWLHLGLLKNQISCIPSISLGAINLTPIEISQIFQIIASGGYKSSLSLISTVLSHEGIL